MSPLPGPPGLCQMPLSASLGLVSQNWRPQQACPQHLAPDTPCPRAEPAASINPCSSFPKRPSPRPSRMPFWLTPTCPSGLNSGLRPSRSYTLLRGRPQPPRFSRDISGVSLGASGAPVGQGSRMTLLFPQHRLVWGAEEWQVAGDGAGRLIVTSQGSTI